MITVQFGHNLAVRENGIEPGSSLTKHSSTTMSLEIPTVPPNPERLSKSEWVTLLLAYNRDIVDPMPQIYYQLAALEIHEMYGGDGEPTRPSGQPLRDYFDEVEAR